MWRKSLLFVLVSILILMMFNPTMGHAQDNQTPPRIIGYYTSWSIYARGYMVTDIPADKLTHLNYAFANISKEGEVILGDEWADVQFPYPDDEGGGESDFQGNFRQFQLLKEAHPNLQTLISIGGWTWSGRFSDVALTEESRQKFAQSAVDFMVRYGFDGVDLDWEYPTGGGLSTNTSRPEDKENFILLLAEVRAQLDAQGEKDGRHYLLTIATGAGRFSYEGLEWARIHPLLDWINVMAYDMSGGWSEQSGFNAPLYDSSESPVETTSVDTALQDYLAFGIPPEKLSLGVAFYARAFNKVEVENNGLHQPFKGLPSGTWEAGVFDYQDLAENFIGHAGYERFWHEQAQVPWLYNAEKGMMITYDDPESLALKAAYVREHGLGGVMIWELSSDTDDAILLTVLFDTLNAPDEE
jgi:chitinase